MKKAIMGAERTKMMIQQSVGEASKEQSQQYGELRTKAWLSAGWFRLPKEGFLELRSGRLRFVTKANEKVFDVSPGEVQAEFPIYYCLGGGKLTVGGQRYYISFVRPGTQSAIAGITGFMAWRQWRGVLTRS